MQDHYNLFHRDAERGMAPLYADQGIGVMSWSPPARGRVTRAWDTATARAETDEGGRILYSDGDQAVAARVHEIAGTSASMRSRASGVCPGPDRLGLGHGGPGGDLAHRQDHQAGPTGRRGRRGGRRTRRGRGRLPGGAPPAAVLSRTVPMP
ncbi:hypothetical protein ACIRF8_31580 [Streptomyces sp. NPDC102406]|uniref:hypothetical protein n=1 Tax=Streptomyces sp. NPDC102406 TaxID=3366171 RepID=UPI0038224A53